MSAPVEGSRSAGLRVAAVFDRVDGSGGPWFSPQRRRVVDADERGRLVGYLAGAPLVLRAQGLEPDPLDPGRGAVVPLGYRTDGVWVWQEASAYFLERYGVAPPQELVEHVAGCDYVPPAELPVEVLIAAGDAALSPESVFREPVPEVRYFASLMPGYTTARPSGLMRQRLQGDGHWAHEALHRDMRWRSTSAFVSNARDGSRDLRPISESQASAAADLWWREWSGAGP